MYFLTFLVLLGLKCSATAVTDPASPAPPKPATTPLTTLHAKLNSLARKHIHFDNDSERRDQLHQLRAAILSDAGEIHIEMLIPITDVHWKDGKARILTKNEVSKFRTAKSKRPVTISRIEQFCISTTRDKANDIKPNAKVKIEARLFFIPTKSPFPDGKHGRALYRVNTIAPKMEQLGYYATQDLRFTINGTTYDAVEPFVGY